MKTRNSGGLIAKTCLKMKWTTKTTTPTHATSITMKLQPVWKMRKNRWHAIWLRLPQALPNKVMTGLN